MMYTQALTDRLYAFWKQSAEVFFFWLPWLRCTDCRSFMAALWKGTKKMENRRLPAIQGFCSLGAQLKPEECQKKKRKQPLYPHLASSPLPLPDNCFRPGPFWLLSFLMGRRAGVVLLFFFFFIRGCSDPSVLLTSIHWLLWHLEGLVWEGCLQTVTSHSYLFEKHWFSIYTCCYGCNCMQSIYKSHCKLHIHGGFF